MHMQRTPENRHISSPPLILVISTSSPTHVKSLVPSWVIATGPSVCKGAMTLAFLKLKRCNDQTDMCSDKWRYLRCS